MRRQGEVRASNEPCLLGESAVHHGAALGGDGRREDGQKAHSHQSEEGRQEGGNPVGRRHVRTRVKRNGRGRLSGQVGIGMCIALIESGKWNVCGLRLISGARSGAVKKVRL